MRCLPVAQLKLLEFVGDLFLCIAASNCSFRFFNLQSVLRVNRKTIILSLTIVCHFITFFQQVWRNNLEAPTKTRRKRIKPVWQVFSSYKLLQSRIRQVCTLSEFCFIPLKSNNNSLFGKFTFVSWYIFTRPLYFDPGGGGRGGYSWDFSVGLCRPADSPNPDPISHQKCQFSQPFSDLVTKIHIHSQIIPLRN